jgi:beta-galactosidase
VLDEDAEGRPVTMRAGNVTYLGGWPDPAASCATSCCAPVGRGCRDRRSAAGHPRAAIGHHAFIFNHGPEPVEFEGRVLPPAGGCVVAT